MQLVILSGILLITLLFLRWLKRLTAISTALPPGPNGYPIIGNLLDMPSVTPWKTFTDWSKVYGDVVYLNLASQPTVVLNSAKAAFDLLEKRSDIYSDRPTSTVVEMIFWDWNIGLMPYSPKWRSHRREFHQYFNQGEVPKFQPIQLRECRAFLRRALNSNNDNDLGQHVRHIFTAIILKIAYDMDITDIHDEYVRLAEEAVLGLSVVMLPGAHWVEYFPFLKHLPEWFPGFLVKRTTNYYRPIVETMRNKPFDKIQQDIHDGKATPSLTTWLIERMQRRSGSSVLSPTDEELARNVSGISYAAAADTTTSAAQSFMIAMSLYPDIQRKAQEELYRVVGPDRLPDFDDHDDLVYIQAIALEAMRWMVVLPLGVYHRVMTDDIYNGSLIPKGSTVIANAWFVVILCILGNLITALF
ncbi:hypothetical protein QCA50_015430 [Cerrena zonata]|uniref:Cytochrome P450 n=1 Tax=Cerrena zonata TaxID=2478898 RepID=A0AAW0FSY3_9APHY